MYIFFFFFKQKTAYEMRISDWSSDVCSSDLAYCIHFFMLCMSEQPGRAGSGGLERHRRGGLVRADRRGGAGPGGPTGHDAGFRLGFGAIDGGAAIYNYYLRSEEHTSELHSLMRISYAVFCLKKKKKSTLHSIITTSN